MGVSASVQFSYPISNILQSAVLEGPPPDLDLTKGQLLNLEVTQRGDSPGQLHFSSCGQFCILCVFPLQCVLTFIQVPDTICCCMLHQCCMHS